MSPGFPGDGFSCTPCAPPLLSLTSFGLDVAPDEVDASFSIFPQPSPSPLHLTKCHMEKSIFQFHKKKAVPTPTTHATRTAQRKPMPGPDEPLSPRKLGKERTRECNTMTTTSKLELPASTPAVGGRLGGAPLCECPPLLVPPVARAPLCSHRFRRSPPPRGTSPPRLRL